MLIFYTSVRLCLWLASVRKENITVALKIGDIQNLGMFTTNDYDFHIAFYVGFVQGLIDFMILLLKFC